MPSTSLAPAPLERLERLVQRITGRSDPLSATELEGGASTRRFFRVALGPGASAIAMFVPDAARPDEIGKTHEGGRRWPLLEVRELLAERGVRVPALVGEACEDGFVLVEDLGDDTLANYLARVPAHRERLYERAVADLARAQEALAALPARSIVSERAFDHDLLKWEIEHFREWGLEARGIELTPADRALFDELAERLAGRIAAWPRGFVHRDYQSRNLMVELDPAGEPGLAWIDFQDALLGPRVYDLVALLGDSYQTFDRDFIEARLDDYARARGLDAAGRREVGREFDLVTVQRKLKDAGRFVFIDRVKQNPSFLEFVEPTIAKVRAALDRLKDEPDLVRLGGLLERVLG
ncbi:MAG: phosphotransferase [Sorangiineae bacterium]|nr:phosphotransferase [Polyangiaceae bacterium]MEB2324460.1 phosphotransferase [Sorangiineae bacterium]